jgi:hypothetical protein
MPSVGQPLRLGPFLGGLNTGSDPTAIADAELATCLNMELDIDGSLISRPPLKELAGPGGITERFVCLCDAVFAGTHYLIVSNSNGVFYYSGGSWGTITTTVQSYAAVQYADKVYIVARPGSANPGGKWDPSGGFVAVAAIPKGQACVIHKERLFIAPGILSTTNASRLSFSDPGNFDTWPGANIIDVSQGDGTNLMDLTVYQDNLLLFKNHSTYVLAYDIRPADAVVRKISNTIGVPAQYCVLNYENQVYCFHNGWVYEIINYDFNRLNTKVPFIRDATAPTTFAAENTFIGLVGDRLVIRFLRKVYAYGLRTRTWSEWDSVEDPLHYFGPIVKVKMDTGPEFYAGSSLLANLTLIRILDGRDSTNVETVINRRQGTGNATSATLDYIQTTDASASDMFVDDICQLCDAAAVPKEATLFRVTNKVSSGGNTKIYFTPNSAVAAVSTDRLIAIPTIKCNIKTKNFDMAISHQFKRLWWWGADVSTNREITGIATPIVVSFNVTWDQLSAFRWDQLNTWAQPLTSPSQIKTIQATGTGTQRRFAKFLNSLRYRQINFEVRLITDGGTVDGPARLFTMLIITASKQTVPRGVN